LIKALIRLKNNQKNDKYSSSFSKTGISIGQYRSYVPIGPTKRIYPTLFRHQILTYLTSKGILDAKIQLISGHKKRESLGIYQDLSLEEFEKEYGDVMKDFPIQ
jgi:hypothetical protein